MHAFTPSLLAELQTTAEVMKRSASSPFYKPAKRARVAPKKASVAKTVRATIRRMATKNSLISIQGEVILSTSTPGAITSFTDCSFVGDGSRPTDRTSGTISLDKLRCKGTFVAPNAGTSPISLRLVVGYIKNQVAPSPTFPMFESAYGEGAARNFNDLAGTLHLIHHPLNSRDFTLLSERVVSLGSSGVDAKNMYTYDFTIPLKGRKIHYEGNTEGPGNQDLNLVIGAWLADPQSDATILTAEWTGCNQLWFTDKI